VEKTRNPRKRKRRKKTEQNNPTSTPSVDITPEEKSKIAEDELKGWQSILKEKKVDEIANNAVKEEDKKKNQQVPGRP